MNTTQTTETKFYKVRAGWYETGPAREVGVYSIVLIDEIIGTRNFWNVGEYVLNEDDGGLDHCSTGDIFNTLADAKRYVRALINFKKERSER